MDYKKLFEDTSILNPDTKVPGEFNWYPYGWKIRNLYVGKIRNILEKAGYEEWHFTDFLSAAGVETMHSAIMPIRQNLYPASGLSNKNRRGLYYFAPTHEVSVSEALAEFIRHEDQLPLKLMHIGPAFRRQYKARFPFALSKRNTYIEAHEIYTSKNQMERHLPDVIEMVRGVLNELLTLPFVESTRPGITNKPVSKRTIGMDVLTPMMRTLHSGMVYVQEDIFTKAFGVKFQTREGQERHPHVIHYGFTDNLLMASIIHGFDVGDNIRIVLPHEMMPNHISITCTDENKEKFDPICRVFEEHGLRFEKVRSFTGANPRNKQIYDVINLQNPYVHLRLGKKSGTIEYRRPDSNAWVVGEIDDILSYIASAKMQRNEFLKQRKKSIIADRLVTVDNKSEINELISDGKVVEIFLDDSDETIISMEKDIDGGEILGFNDSEPGICIFTGGKISKKAFIAKRI